MEEKWRFPASNHNVIKGISSGDAEAFRKQPYEAFAREILQNSVDASSSDEEPVRVEFNVFKLKTEEIPGIKELKDNIRRAKAFWNHKDNYVEECEKIEHELNEEYITCLRISDYNTTGLVGVETSIRENNHFLALTRGSGVSEKNNTVSGGSKGVGKNAAFVMSKIKTVLYSTRANQDINKKSGEFIGSLGVVNFISAFTDDNDVPNRDYTQGNGYYGLDENNRPLQNLLNFDNAVEKRKNEFGTDIFILGFRDNNSWKEDVINSILDSFMAAIMRNKLVIEFGDSVINKDNLENIIKSNIITDKNRNNIVSQYRLLKGGNDVSIYPIETDYGTCELYVLPLKKEEEKYATHKCAMIRHPLMKIKDHKLGGNYNVSAMCIIGDDSLGKMLSMIENPQHIDWEPKRILDNSALRKEYSNLLNDIYQQIFDRIIECLQIDNDDPLDPNGAGDFLPDIDPGDGKAGDSGSGKFSDKTTVSKIKTNKPIEHNANNDEPNGNGIEPDIGKIEESEDGDALHPTGHNFGGNGDVHEGDGEGTKIDGDSVTMVRSQLSGVRYKVISTNKEEGLMRIIFVSPTNFNTCYLKLSLLDDSNNSEKVEILEMKCNGLDIYSNDRIEYGPFEVKVNNKYVLDIKTNMKGFFGSEVKVICK